MAEEKKIMSNIRYCAVKNCHAIIPEGDQVKIGEDFYCRKCGTQIVMQSFLGIS